MIRLAKSLVACSVVMPAMLFAQSAQTIYKFVDESGRVTYANSPIKGGTKLDLEPLTVIQSSTGPAGAQTPAVRSVAVAKVVSVPSPTYTMAAAPITFPAAAVSPTLVVPTSAPSQAPSSAIVASLNTDNAQERAQQRRADVRLRLLQSEIRAEEKSLDATRVALAEEQRRSSDIRTKRASFAATIQTATLLKPLISPEARAEIEQHFERIRNLQDELSVHEGNIAALREELQAR